MPLADENTYFPYSIPATLFSTGANTIAVELHQKGWTNQDLSFDLRLTANQSSVDRQELEHRRPISVNDVLRSVRSRW